MCTAATPHTLMACAETSYAAI